MQERCPAACLNVEAKCSRTTMIHLDGCRLRIQTCRPKATKQRNIAEPSEFFHSFQTERSTSRYYPTISSEEFYCNSSGRLLRKRRSGSCRIFARHKQSERLPIRRPGLRNPPQSEVQVRAEKLRGTGDRPDVHKSPIRPKNPGTFCLFRFSAPVFEDSQVEMLGHYSRGVVDENPISVRLLTERSASRALDGLFACDDPRSFIELNMPEKIPLCHGLCWPQ